MCMAPARTSRWPRRSIPQARRRRQARDRNIIITPTAKLDPPAHDANGQIANRYDYDYYAQAEVTEVEVVTEFTLVLLSISGIKSGAVHTDIGVRISNFFRVEDIEHEIGPVQLKFNRRFWLQLETAR